MMTSDGCVCLSVCLLLLLARDSKLLGVTMAPTPTEDGLPAADLKGRPISLPGTGGSWQLESRQAGCHVPRRAASFILSVDAFNSRTSCRHRTARSGANRPFAAAACYCREVCLSVCLSACSSHSLTQPPASILSARSTLKAPRTHPSSAGSLAAAIHSFGTAHLIDREWFSYTAGPWVL